MGSPPSRVGTFAGLPQAAIFVVDGVAFQIDYAGGTGNDIVLTVVPVPPNPTPAPNAVPALDNRGVVVALLSLFALGLLALRRAKSTASCAD